MLYLFTKNIEKVRALYADVLDIAGIKYKVIDPFKSEITLWNETVKIDNVEILHEDIIYNFDIISEFPFTPDVTIDSDYRFFQDSYVSQQQIKSHVYSTLSILSRTNLIINDFDSDRKIYNRISVLEELVRIGLKTTDYIMTNSLNEVIDYFQNTLLWSYTELKSPIKKITKDILPELLTKDNFVPYMFYEDIKGKNIRVWIINRKPALAAFYDEPELKGHDLKLEKYEYIVDLDFFNLEAESIANQFGLYFMEIYGKIDSSGNFIAFGIDNHPDISTLGKEGKEYLSRKLISEVFNLNLPVNLPKPDSRNTVFLKKMLEPLFERKPD
ncbi:MAG: hypothetical protein JXR48_11310 [Candidatus Delongbacteria bacterium]|nr:hypothetical protein [Candidatus Delongbacteria bacterium]MBN2835541.1 hypothetical protein [Candidatus Delongbacteria bacterium]